MALHRAFCGGFRLGGGSFWVFCSIGHGALILVESYCWGYFWLYFNTPPVFNFTPNCNLNPNTRMRIVMQNAKSNWVGLMELANQQGTHPCVFTSGNPSGSHQLIVAFKLNIISWFRCKEQEFSFISDGSINLRLFFCAVWPCHFGMAWKQLSNRRWFWGLLERLGTQKAPRRCSPIHLQCTFVSCVMQVASR